SAANRDGSRSNAMRLPSGLNRYWALAHGLWWGKAVRHGATPEPKSQSSPSSVAARREVFAVSHRGLKPSICLAVAVSRCDKPAACSGGTARTELGWREAFAPLDAALLVAARRVLPR